MYYLMNRMHNSEAKFNIWSPRVKNLCRVDILCAIILSTILFIGLLTPVIEGRRTYEDGVFRVEAFIHSLSIKEGMEIIRKSEVKGGDIEIKVRTRYVEIYPLVGEPVKYAVFVAPDGSLDVDVHVTPISNAPAFIVGISQVIVRPIKTGFLGGIWWVEEVNKHVRAGETIHIQLKEKDILPLFKRKEDIPHKFEFVDRCWVSIEGNHSFMNASYIIGPGGESVSVEVPCVIYPLGSPRFEVRYNVHLQNVVELRYRLIDIGVGVELHINKDDVEKLLQNALVESEVKAIDDLAELKIMIAYVYKELIYMGDTKILARKDYLKSGEVFKFSRALRDLNITVLSGADITSDSVLKYYFRRVEEVPQTLIIAYRLQMQCIDPKSGLEFLLPPSYLVFRLHREPSTLQQERISGEQITKTAPKEMFTLTKTLVVTQTVTQHVTQSIVEENTKSIVFIIGIALGSFLAGMISGYIITLTKRHR